MGKDYYIFSNGRIKRQDNTVYFINEELDKKALPIEQVDQIHIFGELDLNTKLLNYIRFISKIDLRILRCLTESITTPFYFAFTSQNFA